MEARRFASILKRGHVPAIETCLPLDLERKMARSKHVPERRSNRNIVGKQVSRIRRELGLTQQDLAGRLAAIPRSSALKPIAHSLSSESIRDIESGEREVTDIELKDLAKALKVAVTDLYS